MTTEKSLNKCKECGYLHGCHKIDCSVIGYSTNEKPLSEKECNILTNALDLNNQEEKAICPKCLLIKSKYFVGKECFICSIRNKEGDPLSGWKKSILFVKISLPKERLKFVKGFKTEDVKEAVEKSKEEINVSEDTDCITGKMSNPVMKGEIWLEGWNACMEVMKTRINKIFGEFK